MIIDDEPARAKGISFEGVLWRMVPDSMTFDVDRIRDRDIRVWCVLAHAARYRDHCGSTDQQIAAKLRVSVPSVQRSLLRLVKAGYVDRVPDGLGGRKILLNPAGDGAADPGLRVMGGAEVC